MESIVAKLLEDFEQGKMTRRQLIQSVALAATAVSAVNAAPAADGYIAKATAINHVSYQVSDYRKARDFYAGLFGMQVSRDDGMQCRLSFGDNILIVRNRMPAGKVDHIAYSIANWDTDKSVKPAVEAELKRRGLQIRTTEGSFHVQDPDGFEVQMGGKEQ
jgi:catechol 2,3-dioxygenase-like lactoylglutathione lyase family enzyme